MKALFLISALMGAFVFSPAHASARQTETQQVVQAPENFAASKVGGDMGI